MRKREVEMISLVTHDCFLSFKNAKSPLFRLIKLAHSILVQEEA